MTIDIQPEKVEDFYNIAELTAEAFEINFLDSDNAAWFLGEVSLVDFLRRYKTYDNELCLVALCDGVLVGHIMLTPLTVQLYGAAINAVCVAPVSVKPSHQKQGVGSALMHEALRRAQEKGYAFAYLLGHETYYTRFGFRPGMFGDAAISVSAAASELRLDAVQFEPKHLACVEQWYQTAFHAVHLAHKPVFSITEWKSTLPFVKTLILQHDEKAVSYIRYIENPDQTISVKSILCGDCESLQGSIAYLFQKYPANRSLRLPLAPGSCLVSALNYDPIHELWDAGMIRILDEYCEPVKRYCDDIASRKDLVWMPTFPACFDCV